ncbi:tetratricopeptide repeat protein [Bdellovibrionota bacterium]
MTKTKKEENLNKIVQFIATKPHFIGGSLLSLLLVASIAGIFFFSGNVNQEPKTTPKEKKPVVTNETILKRIDTLSDSGLQRYKEGNFELATILLETAWMFSTEPLKNKYLEALDDSYLISGQYDKGTSISNTLITINPENPAYYTKLGLSYLGKGDYASAIEEFNQALQLDENNRSVQLYLGLAYRLTGNKRKMEEIFKTTEEQYKEVLQVNEQDIQSLLELTTLYIYSEKNLNQATKYLTQAKNILLEEDIFSSDLLLDFYIPMLEGMILHLENDYYNSLLKLTDAVEHSPPGVKSDLAKIYYFLGKNYVKLQNPNPAKRFFARALEIDPHNIYQREMREFLRN